MNQVSTEEKDAMTKTFAIVGFIVLVIFAVWLAVKIVSIIPSAFSSLASLADSVYNYDKNNVLVVSTGNSVINAGETFTISWTEMRKNGTYSFSYECTEGVSVDVKDAAGKIVSVACDTPFELDSATSLEVLVASEKHRFVDVAYTISFTENDADEASLAASKNITIVNATIPTTGAVVVTPQDTPVVVTPSKPVVSTPTKTPTYTAGKPVTTTKVVYAIPVSDPKGKIDLVVSYIGVGTLEGKTFTPSKTIDTDEQGAIQFEVKNVGTKTASDWDYVAHLPADITYTSGAQKALKPNERAIITLGFEGITKTGTEKFDVEVTAKDDVKKTNNEFTFSVKIVD